MEESVWGEYLSFKMSYSLLILGQESSEYSSQMLQFLKAASYFHSLMLVLD